MPLSPHIEEMSANLALQVADIVSESARCSEMNSAQLRYIGERIVGKSVLTPYFSSMGIKRGTADIGRAYITRREYFTQDVLVLYYLTKTLPDLVAGYRDASYSMASIFRRHDLTARFVMLRHHYKTDLRASLYRSYYNSSGECERGAAGPYPEIQNDDDRYYILQSEAWLKDHCSDSDAAAMLASTRGKSVSCAAVVIAAIRSGLERDAEVVRYLIDYEEEITHDLTSYHALRDWLFSIEADHKRLGTKFRGFDTFGDFLASVIGFTAFELIGMSTALQDDIRLKLDLMYNGELLEDNTNNNEHTYEMEFDDEVSLSGQLLSNAVPPEVMDLAEKLAKIHGPVTVTREASGIHIYMPDPDLLHTDGIKELYSRHLALNAEKFLGIGMYDDDKNPTRDNRILYEKYRSKGKEVPAAMSMKTKKIYLVSDLLAYLPISRRYEKFKDVVGTVRTGPPRRLLVKDEYGNMVPEWPEHTIPLHELPMDHPAVSYLLSRGFDIYKLEEQFEACYCDKEKPESRAEGRYYSRLPGGMRNSPQGRIIFSVRMNGVRWGYQSRCIDMTVGDRYFFWSPEQRWELIRTKKPDGTYEERFPADLVRFPKGFAPHKYLNAVGAERNKLLMGYDAAVKFNEKVPKLKRFCILVEGPLDAAKIGPPGIALLGKSMSSFQAEAILKHFSKVYVLADNDKAGQEMLHKVETMLPSLSVESIEVPNHVKDAGDLSYEEVRDILAENIPRYIEYVS